MRLAGAVSERSGAVNEDGWGFLGSPEDVTAAWVFDGVTGINGRNYLMGDSDAAWLVGRAHGHLLRLAGGNLPLGEILAQLVKGLIADWHGISAGLALPADYDPPAACLVLAKRYGYGWKALRLGDSCLMVRNTDGAHRLAVASPNNSFDHWLAGEAAKRRAAGVLDVKTLLAEFAPQLKKGRAGRNTPGGYGILEASAAATAYAEYLDLGLPGDILLCTDGYYRAVDHYRLYDDQSLFATSGEAGGVARVLAALRAVEAGDPACQTYPRFKPADDATAVMLRGSR
ncbi:MAG: protein phosphatase 2C domain-containing protein [Rhizobiales bacterium]|nr:protein phosphatase 2C domain-containing protein [Hyphomicrobiales bacterium]MBI3673451.1 protein phosphatase 2C domain-containing protein [Hyphomicrobiales bacterium]